MAVILKVSLGLSPVCECKNAGMQEWMNARVHERVNARIQKYMKLGIE